MLNHAEILRISTLLEGQILSASVRDLLGELLLSPSVHYRLRAIRGGPFGVVNFAFHFISVQIFQMEILALPLILSVSKYSRYIFGGWNEQLQITTKAWKGPS